MKTSGYGLQPQRVYKENQPPTIVGYEARNSVTVITGELNKVGSIIDAATQAGSNEVAGIGFTLRQDRPARDRALSEATREAISKAQVIGVGWSRVADRRSPVIRISTTTACSYVPDRNVDNGPRQSRDAD